MVTQHKEMQKTRLLLLWTIGTMLTPFSISHMFPVKFNHKTTDVGGTWINRALIVIGRYPWKITWSACSSVPFQGSILRSICSQMQTTFQCVVVKNSSGRTSLSASFNGPTSNWGEEGGGRGCSLVVLLDCTHRAETHLMHVRLNLYCIHFLNVYFATLIALYLNYLYLLLKRHFEVASHSTLASHLAQHFGNSACVFVC